MLPHKWDSTAGRIFDGLRKFLQGGEDVSPARGIDLLQNGQLPLHEVLPQAFEQRLPLW
jgi:hypothetical protein